MSNNNDFSICGIKAINAVFKNNPDRIRRLFFNEDTAKICGGICKYMASKKKIYRLVPDEELQKISDSIHHGGIVAIIEAPRLNKIDDNVVNAWVKNNSAILVLDGISNSHNLGAIIRSAAFLGYNDIIIANTKGQAKPSSSTYRIAEGGMEFVNIYMVDSISMLVDKISTSFYIIGASVRARAVLNKKLLIDNKNKPIALVLGNEEMGISDAVEKKCHLLLKISGTGNVESLNVTAAATVFMSYLKDY